MNFENSLPLQLCEEPGESNQQIYITFWYLWLKPCYYISTRLFLARNGCFRSFHLLVKHSCSHSYSWTWFCCVWQQKSISSRLGVGFLCNYSRNSLLALPPPLTSCSLPSTLSLRIHLCPLPLAMEASLSHSTKMRCSVSSETQKYDFSVSSPSCRLLRLCKNDSLAVSLWQVSDKVLKLIAKQWPPRQLHHPPSTTAIHHRHHLSSSGRICIIRPL